MSAKKRELIYWDTCIFFAFLKEEKNKTDHQKEATMTDRHQEIAMLIEKAEKKELIIATSAITITEAFKLDGEIPEEDIQIIRSFLLHEFIQIINVDRAIGYKTQDIRQKYH